MRKAWAVALTLVIATAAAGTAHAEGRCGEHPWCDTSLSADRRAELLLAALTPAEQDRAAGRRRRTPSSAPRARTRGRRRRPAARRAAAVPHRRAGRRRARAEHGAARRSIALAATFDRRLARAPRRAWSATRRKLKGNDLVYAPTVNILRTPLWGRAFETFGEDPFLDRPDWPWRGSAAAQAQGVIANVKHFAANNQEGATGRAAPIRRAAASRSTRGSTSARCARSTCRSSRPPSRTAGVGVGDVRLQPPQRPARLREPRAARPTSCAATGASRGFVLADYGASKHVGTGLRGGPRLRAVAVRRLRRRREPHARGGAGGARGRHRRRRPRSDAPSRRLLRTLFAYGFFDRAAYADDDSRVDRAGHQRDGAADRRGGHRAAAERRRAAARRRRLRSLAVIGADADRYVNGGGSSNIAPYASSRRAAGIAARAGAALDVRYDDGTDPARAAERRARRRRRDRRRRRRGRRGRRQALPGLDCGAERRRAQRRADRARWPPRTPGRSSCSRPPGPCSRRGATASRRSSRPGTRAARPARPSPACCSATSTPAAGCPRRSRAPSATCRPRATAGATPASTTSCATARASSSATAGSTSARLRPAFPFGHGLSYTRFALRDLRVRAGRRGTTAGVGFTVVNRGRRRGIAVPQLYLGLPSCPGSRPAAAPAQGLHEGRAAARTAANG